MDMFTFRKALEAENYIFDEEFLIPAYIAVKLEKPLLIEGAAGVGKTEVAKVLSNVFNADLIRLQCYEGLDEAKALYEWNYQKQLLSIQMNMKEYSLSNSCKIPTQQLEGLFSRDFLLERPLLQAILSDKKAVLLIDEVDKSDEAFEAFLLELLSDFQVSIPELGTLHAKSRPIVILTSNNTRQLSDALKRRCVYLFIDYPNVEKEMKIIRAKIPQVDERLARGAANAVASIRSNAKIFKKPSIAETLDWVMALTALGKTRLDKEAAMNTLGFLMKNREDWEVLEEEGGFDEILSTKHK